jgi:hypothetical protein
MKTKMIFKIEIVILIFGVLSFSSINNEKTASLSRIETFTFSSNGTNTKGKIYLPDSFATNKDLLCLIIRPSHN